MADEARPESTDLDAPKVKNPPVLRAGDLPARSMELVSRNFLLVEHLQLAVVNGIKAQHFAYGPDAANAMSTLLKANEQLLRVHQMFEARSSEGQPNAKKMDPQTARALAEKLSRAIDGPGDILDIEPDPLPDPVKRGRGRPPVDHPSVPIEPKAPSAVEPGVEARLRAALDEEPNKTSDDSNYPALMAEAAAQKLKKSAQAEAILDPAAADAAKEAKAASKPTKDLLADLRKAVPQRKYGRPS